MFCFISSRLVLIRAKSTTKRYDYEYQRNGTKPVHAVAYTHRFVPADVACDILGATCEQAAVPGRGRWSGSVFAMQLVVVGPVDYFNVGRVPAESAGVGCDPGDSRLQLLRFPHGVGGIRTELG